MAVAADQPNATSTLGSPAQQQGVRARGSYGGAIGRSWLATVPRRAGASTAEQRRSCCGALGERRNEEEAERVRVSGEAQGALQFKPASARRGQGDPSAWRTRGGRSLLSVGHDRSEGHVSAFIESD